MIYPEILCCLNGKSRILCKEKDETHYTYKTLKKVIKLLEEKKEIYSFSPVKVPNKIIAIEDAYAQEFTEITTFNGSRIMLGSEAEVHVDGEWLRVYQIEWHEKIFIYDILSNMWRDTYITSIKPYKRDFAYKLHAENDTGIVANNFIVRFIESVVAIEEQE